MRWLTLLLIGCTAATSQPARPAPNAAPYRDPIVFERREHDEKTGQVRFTGKLWVMESDGSSLRQLTFGTTLDNHPAFLADKTHVLYLEFPDNALGDTERTFSTSKLIKLNIYTGAREVLLEEPDCTFDHLTLSYFEDTPIYGRLCGPAPRMMIPPDPRREVRIGIGAKSYVPALDKYMRQLVGQKPLVASERSSPADVRCIGAGGHHQMAQDGTLFFECRAVSSQSDQLRAMIVSVKLGDPNATARLFFDNGLFNHHLVVSPDGRWIAWSSDSDVRRHAMRDGAIFLARTDGSHVERISTIGGAHLLFSRDGKSIIFDANLTGQWELWRVDLATRKHHQLTYGGARYSCARFPVSPVRKE